MDILDAVERHLNPGLARVYRFMGLETAEAWGEGALLVDEEGRSYLDFSAGYGVFVHGYQHPRLVAAAQAQLGRLSLSSRVLPSRPAAQLAERLAELTPGDLSVCFFCNSGAEAVEGALKFARLATGRPGYVAAEGAFHGKTFGALSASGRELYKKPFAPLVPGFVHVPFGDAQALDEAVTAETAAVILEPVQGEGGIVVPPQGYLRAAREICDRKGALLVVDEVQTGMGRCGTLFAIEQEQGVVPDLMTLAKGLGGGIMPIGAIVGRPEAMDFFADRPLIHTSTFGGGPLACAVAREALDVMVDEELPAAAAALGKTFLAGLSALQKAHPSVVRDVRGKGLMCGIEMASEGMGGALMSALLERDMLAVYTLNNERVIRLMPPLVVTSAQIDDGLRRLEGALEWVEEVAAELREEGSHAAG